MPRNFSGEAPFIDTNTDESSMSTEAIIGLVGVLVALLSMAFPPMWKRWTGSHDQPRPMQATENLGAAPHNPQNSRLFLNYELRSNNVNAEGVETLYGHAMDDMMPLQSGATRD
ncbi:hypothetical protein L13192_12016 [Pyrenophora tritici-repentis]|nr:hypothetical protein L13192_12016 [Pyrenophora tritici-repentis]